EIKTPEVLGVNTESSKSAEATSSATAGGGIGWVEIASESAQAQQNQVKLVTPRTEPVGQAVVNRAMLNVLGIKLDQAVGQKFSVAYSVSGKLLKNQGEKLESAPIEYEIVGVVPEKEAPIFYVPFIDLRSLGVNNFSQAKVVVGNKQDLPQVREKIEAMGFLTHSVADTVDQINNLFSTARIFLALLGLIALGVAALGMFNTLTVSLLERTREVGLMKALGMKSEEVRELFLTESMLMGFFGGILGLILGSVAGNLVGLVLSVFSLTQGTGMIDISSVPILFGVFIVFLSLVVGITTGIYPARRATKISALNALRYE
ncbi:MAG: ABC transporter permease, partial [Patescibacteria group bacterium]|nr:ABC transporter permease [Patescibacteria group bacterium]